MGHILSNFVSRLATEKFNHISILYDIGLTYVDLHCQIVVNYVRLFNYLFTSVKLCNYYTLT